MKVVEIIIQKSVEFSIDLNAKSKDGCTGFHLVCAWGWKEIVKIMIKNATSSNLDLTARNNHGQTGFQLAKIKGMNNIVDVIKREMPNIAF